MPMRVCVRVGGIDRISKNEVIRVAIVEIIFACNPLSYCEKYFWNPMKIELEMYIS